MIPALIRFSQLNAAKQVPLGGSGSSSTVPSAPLAPTASAGNVSASVSWSAPSNGGSAITGYRVTPYIGSTAQSATTVGNILSTNITGLTNDTAYTFKVAAINSVGTGSDSPSSNVVTPTSSGGILSLPRVAWEGGPAYWSQWSKPASTGWTSDTFFPIAVHQGKADHADDLKALGINVYLEMQHDGNPTTAVTNKGIYVIAHYEWTQSEVGSDPRVVAYTVGDECDMGNCGGSNEQESLDIFVDAAAGYRARNDGRFVFANFGNGVLRTSWMTTLMGDMVQATDAACADKYAYTSSFVDGLIVGSPDWPEGAQPSSSGAYGWLVDQLRSFWASNAIHPTWMFVEVLRPLLAEEIDVPITPDQLEGAVWACIIHEARGIAYFQHNDSGCGLYALIDCATSNPDTVSRVLAVNTKIALLAPVINTQSYVYNFNNGTNTMLKVKDGFAYIFAGIGLLQSPGNKTFTLPSGVTGTTVTVVSESRTINVSGGSFTDNFAAEYSHHVYKVAL